MNGLAVREVFKRFCGSSLLQRNNCTSCCLPRYLSTSWKDDKPKKPPTHFLLYLQNIRKDLKQEYPASYIHIKHILNVDKSASETAKIATVMYKDLPANDKKKLFEISSRLLAEYKSKKLEWECSLTEADKDELVEERKTKKGKKQKRKIKTLRRENGMPRQHGTFSFGMFMADQLEGKHLQFMEPKERKDFLRQHMTECSELWKHLPETKKEIYITRAQEQRKLHEMEMIVWEAEMVKEGKLALIRKSSLKKVKSEQRKAAKEAGIVKRRKSKTVVAKKTGKSKMQKKTVAKKTGVKSTKSDEEQKSRVKEEHGSDSDYFSSDTDSN